MRDLPVIVPVTALSGLALAAAAVCRQAVPARRFRNLPGPGAVIVIATLLARNLTGPVAALAATLPPAARARPAVMTSPPVLTLAGYICAGILAAGLYLLPLLIGRARRVPRLGMLAVLDVTLGWTGIGWLLALLTALRRPARSTAPALSPRACPPVPAIPQPAVSAAGQRQPGDAPPLPFLPGPDEAS